jgi:hypothetical protein
MKLCFKCLQDKPRSEFYRHPQMGDGLLGKCKECTKADATATRLAKIEHYRSYDRMRASQPHRIALAKRVQSEWRTKHPDRKKAHTALGNAVRDGRVMPWPVCAIPDCKDRPEAHHAQYDDPLSVVWLCSSHHKQAHALARKAA